VPPAAESPLAPPVCPPQASARGARLALCALFAASGCAALIYQVVWFQLLSLVIGASAISLGVLLATFLGGMCIGSAALARCVSVRRNPLRVYALIEVGIGILGLVALYAIPALGRVYAELPAAGAANVGVRLAVAALCLLPATILMGATLPAVARWSELGGPRGAVSLGLVYAANTGGAVVGSVLAGFYLLRVHDVQLATLLAAALNLGAAAGAVVLAARAPSRTASSFPSRARSPRPTLPPHGTPLWPIYAATALSGATALSAEVLWTRHLSLIFGGTVYTFSLILAVFLFGIGAGAAGGSMLARRASAGLAFATCQLLLCGAVTWAAYALARLLPYWPIDVTLPETAAVALRIDLLRTALAILPAALLWGASFPLALAAATRPVPHADAEDDSRRTIGRVYAANTFGAIAGALVTTFVLVTWLGSERAQEIAIVVTACSALLLVWPAALARNRARARVIASVVAVAVAAACAYAVPELPPQLVAFGRFLPTRGLDANVVYVGEGLTASIAVTREPSGILTYHNAGKTQASTYPQDLRLQRMLGHATTLFAESPRSVLVIGLGAGITAGAVSVDPAVERVVVAEIEPLVPKVADAYFAAQNFGVVGNPKVEVRIDDGRHVLATTREKFDAITSDPLDPWVKGAATLYTREFWELCKSRLNDGGIVTAFLQLYETGDAAVKSEIATFFAAFPNGALLANTVDGLGYDAVLVGRVGDAPIDLDRMQARLERTAYERVASSLRAIGIDSALDLAGTYAGQAQDLARWLDGAQINTDRNLRLQYLAGDAVNTQGAAAIFAAITAHEPRFPDTLFTGSPARLEALRQRIAARRGSFQAGSEADAVASTSGAAIAATAPAAAR
jgi:spermidine synthase